MKLIFVLLFLSAVLMPACAEEGATTWTLRGSVDKAGVADGVSVYAKLVAQGATGAAAALYWTQATFAGGSADYQIDNIPPGSYTLHAFIDMNGNAAGGAAAMPDSGDLVASMDVVIEGVKTLQSPEEGAWVTL